MKILFYNHTGQASGAERLLLMILARLDHAAFDPIMVCPESGTLAQMVTDTGIPVETLTNLEARFTWRVDHLARYCRSFLQVMRQLRAKVTSINPDLIHANSIRAGLVATAATFGLGTHVVWHLHDLLPRHPLSTLIRIFASLSKRTRMIAVSDAVARNFRGRFSPLIGNRVGVILNAIDLDKFKPTGPTPHAIRNEFGLNEEDFIIGIIGQLTPRKGQLELIGAFAQAEVTRSTLLIVGAALFNRDSDYAQRLEQEAKARGVADRVRMLGSRSDIGAIMRGLDLLVVNSSAEPFGLVILEAMACGTPVLAVAVDGIPEIIQHGTNGWLVSPGDRRMLAESIAHLSREPEVRARLAAQGKQRVAANFSADRFMTDLETFYQSIKPTRSELKPKAVSEETTTRQADAAKFA
jgi:glycosyltransferase involved in cell wall biosynthesis